MHLPDAVLSELTLLREVQTYLLLILNHTITSRLIGNQSGGFCLLVISKNELTTIVSLCRLLVTGEEYLILAS